MSAAAELAARAAILARAGEREGAGWALYRAATVVDGVDAAATAAYLDQALATVAGLPCPRLRGSIALLAAELAHDADDAAAGAAASVAAERYFQAAADARGFLAVWTARALRALRHGDADLGVAMVRWMLPWLDQIGELAPRLWLRLFGAEALLADGRTDAATQWLLDVLELAPAGGGERVIAAELLVRGLVAVGRRDDAVAIALTELAIVRAPPGLRARLYQTVATTIAAVDPELARACAELVAELDRAGAPPPATRKTIVSPLLA